MYSNYYTEHSSTSLVKLRLTYISMFLVHIHKVLIKYSKVMTVTIDIRRMCTQYIF